MGGCGVFGLVYKGEVNGRKSWRERRKREAGGWCLFLCSCGDENHNSGKTRTVSCAVTGSSNLKCECKVVFQCQQVKHDQTCQKHCRPIFNPVLMCDVSELMACVRT